MIGSNIFLNVKRCFYMTPQKLNKYTPYVFFLVFVIAWYYGTTKVLPNLYASWGNHVIQLHQLFACFIVGQILINWLCIYCVDPAYNPKIHGSIPQSILLSSDSESSQNTSIRLYNHGGDITSHKHNKTRNTFSYWSWSPCNLCNRPRPPRCHHCVLCNKCVLKRDHHCYFARNCVGFGNYRHFAVFTFWAFVATSYGVLHGAVYFYFSIWPYASYIDIIPFYAFIRNLFGYGHYWVGFLIILQWMLLFCAILSISHLTEVVYIITSGRTTFEIDSKIFVIDKRTTNQKVKAVFGEYWALNLIFPLHSIFKEEEDPVYWPKISGIKKDVLLEIATRR